MIKLDGLDEAILGVTEMPNGTRSLVYSMEKILTVLNPDDRDAAMDDYCYNVDGTLATLRGRDGCPIIVEEWNGEEVEEE